MIYDFEGHTPKIDPESWVAPNSVIIGRVELKKYSNYVCSTKGTDSGQSTAYGVFNAILGYNEFKYDSSSIENKKLSLKVLEKLGLD